MPSDRGRHSAGEKNAPDSASPLSEFLNPNSMITPGAAGAITMMITNTLCGQFDDLHPGMTGLAVSFLFGAMVFGYGASLAARMIYYVINSLIVFTVAMGSNVIGQHASDRLTQQPAASKVSEVVVPRTRTDFSLTEANRPPASSDNKGSGQQTPPPRDKSKFFRNWF